jgi:hypothetical protein
MVFSERTMSTATTEVQSTSLPSATATDALKPTTNQKPLLSGSMPMVSSRAVLTVPHVRILVYVP